MTKYIKAFLIFFGGLLFVWLAQQFFYFGNLNIGQASYLVSVDGKKYNTPVRLRLRPGKYNVAFIGPRIFGQTQQVKIGAFKTTDMQAPSMSVTDSQVVERLIGSNSDYDILEAKLFENDTWLVAGVAKKARDEDSGLIIANFKNDQWETVSGGTGLDEYEGLGLPDSVKQYLDQRLANE